MTPVRISRPALLGAYLSGLLTALVLLGCSIAAFDLDDPELAAPGGWMALAGVLLLPATCALVLAVLVHRMWKAIQFGGARLTPGKAVGLCFVPFFNFYWFFPAIGGWAKEYNRVLAERRLGLPRMSEGLALAVPASVLLCLVPYCQVIPMLALVLVLVPLLAAKVAGRVNALADAVERGLPEASPAVAPAPLAAAPAEVPTVAPTPPAPAAGTRLSLLAAASLVLGILGFCTAGLGGLAAMPLGLVAWLRIGKPENRLRGSGLAIAGIVVGALAVLLGLVELAALGIALWYRQ